MGRSAILEVRSLKKYFPIGKRQLHAVDGASFTVERGATLGVVGSASSSDPRIIESWSLSEDGLTTMFTIREGVKFSNGFDFTADDVIFSLDKMNADPMMAYGVGKFTWAKADGLHFTMTAPSPLNDPAAHAAVPYLAKLG